MTFAIDAQQSSAQMSGVFPNEGLKASASMPRIEEILSYIDDAIAGLNEAVGHLGAHIGPVRNQRDSAVPANPRPAVANDSSSVVSQRLASILDNIHSLIERVQYFDGDIEL